MTSEKILFLVTLMMIVTLVAPASYCEPGFSQQATINVLGNTILVLNVKVNLLAGFKCIYCGRFGRRTHFSVSPSTGGPGSATVSPPPSCVG